MITTADRSDWGKSRRHPG